MCDDGEPPAERTKECRRFHFERIKVRSQDAKRLKVPLIITEFGACSNSMGCYEEITNSCDAFDSKLVSWAHWQFKGYGDFTTTGDTNEGLYDSEGNLQENKLRALTRTFIHAW
jgi:endoglycosylceramidase